jgi:signal transduction histidine kinase
MRMGDSFAYEFASALVILLLLGVVLLWALAWKISKPLTELSDRLRSFSLRGPSPGLGQQPFAERQTVSFEFDRMAERLDALRCTPADGIIAASARVIPGGIQLQVRDSGPGTAPHVQARLFERSGLWNVNGAEPGSAGLGLAIAKEIVQAHEGRICVGRSLDHGTCFTIELPTGERA